MGQLRRVAYFVPARLLLSLPAMGQDSLPAETVKSLKASTVYVKTAVGPLKMTGSGFVVQIQGDKALIATNQHVVAKPQEMRVGGFIPGLRGRDRLFLRGLQVSVAEKDPVVTVVFNSGDPEEQILPAEILAALDEPDLAILKVTGIKMPPKAIEFANVPAPVETTPVFILGFPFGDALSTNHGNPNITIGKATLALPTTANQAARQVTVQASFVNKQGQTLFLEPQVLQVNAPLLVTTSKGIGGSTVTTTQKSGNVTIRREVTTTRGGSPPTPPKGGFGFADDEVANGDDEDEPAKKEKTPEDKSEPKE